MARSEAQKRADRKYVAKVYDFLTVKIKKEKSELFREICEADGVTVNTMLMGMIERVIAERKNSESPMRQEVAHEKPGRKPIEYDKALFERLYGQVQSGEITVKVAAETLGVNYAKWHRLAKARKAGIE